MPSFQEMLKELTVTVTSPDNQIKARLVSGKQLTIAFRSGSYEKYDEQSLQNQLAGLGRLTWVGYRRGYMKALNISRGLSEEEQERPHWNAKYRRYHEDIAILVANGESPSGKIKLKAKGLVEWKVKIEPGTVKKLDEAAFVSETMAGFARLRRDFDQKVILLKDEHFGLNIPEFIRSTYQKS